MKPLETISGRVAGLHVGESDTEDLSKAPRSSVSLELDGIVDDNHRGFSRRAYAGDKEPEGTERRNERQWSGVSMEEIKIISGNMDLEQELSASDLGANICFEGLPGFSQLPKGSKFTFPSGAKLVAVEYNPPCIDMGEVLAEKYASRSGEVLTAARFPVAAIGLRGLVGVVDVPGDVHVGDEVIVEIWSEACQVNKPRGKTD
ncbi:MAG: MOSC domain-containing protein [Gammaproteobacteria bacterium]|nr:MOSC domain-containing protein [Gammaproteobacteria bacterium]